MNVFSKVVGPLGVNCYVVVSEEKNAVVIDPGGDAESLLALISGEGITVRYIALTHGHYDHSLAVPDLQAATGAPVLIHEEDAYLLASVGESSFPLLNRLKDRPVTADRLLQDGDCFSVDELTFHVIHTPGHSRGSCIFQCGDCWFTGDTLFAGDIGRTDLEGSDPAAMQASLKRIAAVEADYEVLPGHEESSTLRQEQRQNYALQVWA